MEQCHRKKIQFISPPTKQAYFFKATWQYPCDNAILSIEQRDLNQCLHSVKHALHPFNRSQFTSKHVNTNHVRRRRRPHKKTHERVHGVVQDKTQAHLQRLSASSQLGNIQTVGCRVESVAGSGEETLHRRGQEIEEPAHGRPPRLQIQTQEETQSRDKRQQQTSRSETSGVGPAPASFQQSFLRPKR